jgi:outer membrane protein TolC
MNKKILFRNSLSAAYALTTCALVTCALVFLTGCEPFPGDEKFYEVSIPREKLRQIETLQLQAIKSQEPNQPDANQLSPSELQLTLEQCRALTMANSLELKVQLISPTIAAQRVSEEESRFEAAFFSNMSYIKTDTPVASMLDLVGSEVEASSMDYGLRIPLRTGGTITFDLADRRTKTNVTYPTFNPSYDSDASLSISQPLLRGAGTRANTYAIRIAEYERQITDARTKLEVIRVIAAVDRVYWRLYAARKELDVRRQQYDLAKAQLEQAGRFVSSGERPSIEVIRAEAGVAQRLEGIIVAENNLRDRERELKRVLNKPGLEMQTATVLIPATEPDPIRYDLEQHRLVQTAAQNRMEMLELELQIAQDISSIDYMHNQALPLVTMDYTYNISGLGPTEDDSFDLLYDKRFEDHRFGLQLLVPLGNEAAKSRLRQAFYQRRQRLATRENRAALIELEVLNAIDQLEANWQRILASRQRSILDGRLYKAERRQFELGLGTSTDVLEAQTNFADAQSAEILALAEYQIALVDLAYATGTLLGAAKVRWEPIVPEMGG